MNKSKKVAGIVVNTFLWVFVIFAVIITAMVLSSTNDENGLASINGKSFISIQSGSMEPTIKTGDLIMINLLTDNEKAECKEGDVITYYADLDGDNVNEINTHRIVEVTEKDGYVYYVTKGDNNTTNPVADKDPVQFNNLIGKWNEHGKFNRFAGLGAAMTFLQSSTGFLVVVVLPLVAFFIYELIRFIKILIDIKAKSILTAEDKEEIKKQAINEYLREQELKAKAGADETESTLQQENKE